jgi:outer membrane protein assembly factor BamB
MLSALDGLTGALAWSHTFSPNTQTGPTAAVALGVPNVGDEVIAGEPDGNTYAYKASTGSLVWSKPGAGRPVVAGGTVYVASTNGTLYARDTQSGTLMWKHAAGGTLFAPAVDGSHIFVTSATGGVEALKASDGSGVWSQSITPATSPTVADGVVFFGRQDGKVQALNAATGVRLGSISPANTSLNPQGPVIANGVVYFTTYYDGNGCDVASDPSLYAYGL